MQWSRSFGLKIPVFMLSASDDPRIKQRALQLGAKEFFTKPVDYWDFRVALEKRLGAKLPEATLASE
jgi:PleD family two-component response regulator